MVLINTCHKEWKNRNVLQKWSYRFFFYEILGEKQQCYKKKKSPKIWDLYHVCYSILVTIYGFLRFISHKNYSTEYFDEWKVSNERVEHPWTMCVVFYILFLQETHISKDGSTSCRFEERWFSFHATPRGGALRVQMAIKLHLT